jgi:hypothetical protein
MSNVTAAKRAAQKNRRHAAGRHTGADHRRVPDPEYPGRFLPVLCPICRPGPKKWDRSLEGKAT